MFALSFSTAFILSLSSSLFHSLDKRLGIDHQSNVFNIGSPPLTQFSSCLGIINEVKIRVLNILNNVCTSNRCTLYAIMVSMNFHNVYGTHGEMPLIHFLHLLLRFGSFQFGSVCLIMNQMSSMLTIFFYTHT